jgi:hypothetical protein
MAQMHAITARSSPRIQEEWFTLLITIQNLIKLPIKKIRLISTSLSLRIQNQRRTDARKTSLSLKTHVVDAQLTSQISLKASHQPSEFQIVQ